MSKSFEITQNNIQTDVISSEKPVLVDFWAQWCGPCKMIAPTIEEIAEECSDVLAVGKVNVDTCVDIANQYNVRGIPTLLLFKNGKVVATKVGAASKKQIEEFLQPHM